MMMPSKYAKAGKRIAISVFPYLGMHLATTKPLSYSAKYTSHK